jgi:hypothetical protein
MFWELEELITSLIVVLSTGLFSLWGMRVRLILTGSEEQINLALDRDLEWSRKLWISF